MKLLAILILSVHLFVGCVSLDTKEKEILDTYKESDILIFKSLKTDSVKQFIIVNIESVILGGSEAEFLPHIAAKIEYTPVHDPRLKLRLLSIYKNSEKTDIIITFENSYFEVDKNFDIKNMGTSVAIGSIKKSDVYIYNIDTNLKNVWNDDDVVSIYWQKDIGIIKYDLNNGDSYIRTNL